MGKPRVSYKQTIEEEAVGEAEFSRQLAGRVHFGRVKMKIEPFETKERIHIENEIPKEVLPKIYIPAIIEGAKGAAESGLEWGYPVINIKVTLLDAKYHPTDSSEAAFGAAASMAFADAVSKIGTVLLEPLMRLEIHVPEEYYGGILHDLNGRKAEIQAMDLLHGNLRIIRGRVPLSEMFGYSTVIRSLSQGRATFTMEPTAYGKVPEERMPKLF